MQAFIVFNITTNCQRPTSLPNKVCSCLEYNLSTYGCKRNEPCHSNSQWKDYTFLRNSDVKGNKADWRKLNRDWSLLIHVHLRRWTHQFNFNYTIFSLNNFSSICLFYMPYTSSHIFTASVQSTIAPYILEGPYSVVFREMCESMNICN